MSPRALAAPLHRHTREDEYSYVLEGRMGALLGDDVVEAGPGDLVHKPRNQWHTFWNAGDEPCRILEIISPAGFERFFAELVAMGGVAEADPRGRSRELNDRYGLEMQPDTLPELIERFGLRIGEPLSGGWTPRAALAREQHGGPLAAAAPLALLQPVGGERRGDLVRLLAQQPRGDQPLRHAARAAARRRAAAAARGSRSRSAPTAPAAAAG